MVHIFSSHGPLINQLKPARPISAGFLRALAAAPASTNTTFLCKECTNHVHQHLPQLCPGFPSNLSFSAPKLSSHQIELLVFIRAMYVPLCLHPIPRSAHPWAVRMELCTWRAQHTPLQDSTSQMPHGKHRG